MSIKILANGQYRYNTSYCNMYKHK